MRNILFLFFTICFFRLSGQDKQGIVYGFRHLQTIYNGETVDILIKSKKGDEGKKKPLFLFCQGSLPIPLIITYDENNKKGIYNVFVFNPDSLSNEYHLAIIGKPGIPLIASQKDLESDLSYKDSAKIFPRKYTDHNILDYYVNRDIAVIQFLQLQSWVSTSRLVVAGHSEGSTIAAKLASIYPKVTDLIYSGGNPMGRIMTVIERSRALETDSSTDSERILSNWKSTVADQNNLDASQGDSRATSYGFSVPAPIDYLENLHIPVLVSYGTKDSGCPFDDYLRVKTIREKKVNFTFKAYIGTEHNYFPLKANGEVNYDIFNWDKVANDWRKWLKEH